MNIKSIKIQDALKMKVLPLTDKTGKKRNIDISELSREDKGALFFYFDQLFFEKEVDVLSAGEQMMFCDEMEKQIKDNKLTKKECRLFLAQKATKFFQGHVKELIKKLENKDEKFSDDEREMAMYDLYRMSPKDILPAIPVIIGLLKDENENKQVQHGASLALIKVGAPVFPYLLKELRDEKSFGSIWILFMDMKHRKVDMRPCVPGLRKMLGANEKDYVRVNAARILGIIGKPARAALPELEKNLEEHMNDEIGKHSLETLARIITPRDTNFISILMESLKYEETGFTAREALLKLGEKAVYPFITATYSKNDNVRMHAVRAFGQLGKKAEPAVPRLKELALNESDDYNRLDAFCSLSRIRPRDRYIALFLLEEGLRGKKNKDDELRATIARALSEMGSAAAPAVYEFISILENRGNSSSLREDVAAALEKMGPTAKDALPVLNRIAADKSEPPEMRKYAKKAIRAIKIK